MTLKATLVALGLLTTCASVQAVGDEPLSLSLEQTLHIDQQIALDPPGAGSEPAQAPTPPPHAQQPAPTHAEQLAVHELKLPPKLVPGVDLTLHPPVFLTKIPDAASVESDEDILPRLRRGFAMADLTSDLVLHHQQWYMNRPDYMRRMVERSSRYLHHVIDELEKRGMPTELALLPMVESAYNPMAYSRAKAMGLWQFIPATGKRYKLDQNWWKDERRDIIASTSAALDYLQTIYEMHGDWHLALASYNWGEGAVARAVNKNRARGLPTDYASLTMPAETRNYVPKLQALKNIFNSPAMIAELGLPNIPDRPYFATVIKNAHIDVKVAAQLAEMPVQEFVALNPAHNRPVIPAETALVIPAEKLETFQNNLEEHKEQNKPLSAWQAYTLRPGEKLETVAPRFGMTVARLKEANGIKGKIALPPGFTLLVAGQDGGEAVDMAALPEQPRLPDATQESARKTVTHTVRKGDTLPALAKRYGVSVAELKRSNKLHSDKLAPGSKLTFSVAAPAERKPGKDSAVAKAEAKGGKGAAPSQTASKKAAPQVTRYTVKRGDTISSIARQFKVDQDDLVRWNRVTPKTLAPGQTLTIQLAQNPTSARR